MEVRHLRRPFAATTVEFLAHTLCGCPSHPQVACKKILAESEEAPQGSCGFFPFHVCFVACLLAACCLLAKPVRSSLETKEGYKTKTGSTSSVTLTLSSSAWTRRGAMWATGGASDPRSSAWAGRGATWARGMKKHFRAPSAQPYVWPVAIDPWQLSGPGGRGGGGSRTRTEETSPRGYIMCTWEAAVHGLYTGRCYMSLARRGCNSMFNGRGGGDLCPHLLPYVCANTEQISICWDLFAR